MKYYLVDVCSTVNVDGEDVAFDFINTHFTPETAIAEAKRLSENPDVICVSVHTWIKYADGSTEHAEGEDDDVYYYHHNPDHRDFKGGV